MGHVAKHSAGAGSNRDRSAPSSGPGESAETPAEPVAVKPGEPGERPEDPAGSVVIEEMDPAGPATGRADTVGERTVVRPTMPARVSRRWWQLGRADDAPRPVSHAAGAKPKPTPDEPRRRAADRDPSPGGSGMYGRRTSSAERGDSTGSASPAAWRPAGSDGAVLDSPESDRLRSSREAAVGTGRASRSGSAADGPDASADDEGGVKLKEGQRSALKPSATGTPTYEGMGVEDTAVLPRLGDPLQTQRIWTTRPDPAEQDADDMDDGKGKKGKKGKKIDVTSLLDVGIKLLPEMEPAAPDGPITNARWAALVRAAARRMIWSLPVAGVVAGAASIGAMVRGGPAHYLSGAEPFRLIAWVTSVWLGMLAMICLVGMLAAVRVRATALLGLMFGLLGGISMLMFAAVPPATPIWGLSAKTLTLSCGALYSAGWMAMGWAVFRSRMFSRGDGLMLVLAGPMIGIAGLWMSPFHTAGALLLVAGGLGVAWKSGSTLRAVRAGREADLAEKAGPPLELAEIRPRRARKQKQPPKVSKRKERAKQRDLAKQEAAARRNEAKVAAAAKRNEAKQAKRGSARRNDPAKQSEPIRPGNMDRNSAAARRGDSTNHGDSARRGDAAAPSEWSRQGSSQHSHSDRSRRPDESRAADRSQRTGQPANAGTSPAATSAAKDDKAPRGPGKRRLRVGADTPPAPPSTPDKDRRKGWGFKRDRSKD